MLQLCVVSHLFHKIATLSIAMSLTPAPARPLTVLSQDTYAAFGEPLTGLGGGGGGGGSNIQTLSTLSFTNNPGYISFLDATSDPINITARSTSGAPNTIELNAPVVSIPTGVLNLNGPTIGNIGADLALNAPNVRILQSSIIGVSSINGLPYGAGGAVSSFSSTFANSISTGLISMGFSGTTGSAVKISSIAGGDPYALYVGSGSRAVYLQSPNASVNVDGFNTYIVGTSGLYLNGVNFSSLVAVVKGISSIP